MKRLKLATIIYHARLKSLSMHAIVIRIICWMNECGIVWRDASSIRLPTRMPAYLTCHPGKQDDA